MMMRHVQLLLAIIATLALQRTRADLECAIGWGRYETKHTIKEEQINDGYCDCPLDGADEPHTNACSGSTMGAITGIPAVSQHSKTYQCPQQKKLQIPYSRFQDGICDCCDGSDELPTVCPDICDKVLAEERALREKMAKEFTIGLDKRNKDIEAFQKVLAEKETEKVQVEEQLEGVSERIVEVEAEMDQIKHEYMQQRVNRAGDIAKRMASNNNSNDSTSLTGLLEPLTNEEISNFIVHSCQMAGEMDRASDLDDSTCVPLRLAGLDASLIWGREQDGTAGMKRLHMNVREEGKILADLMMKNAKVSDHRQKAFLENDNDRGSKRNKRNKRGRRRLQEVDDYDYTDDAPYPDDYIDSEDYDEDARNGEDVDDANDNEQNDSESDSEGDSADLEIMEMLKESLFSQPRVAFLQRATEIREGIDSLLKENEDNNKKDEEKKDGDESPPEPEQDQDQIDKAAYETVKKTLGDREEAIERGYDYAVSAKILLNSLTQSTQDQEQLRKDLITLASGTLLYSKLSLAHVWQILQAVLPEFNQIAVDPDNKEKTCSSSPWVAACPPRTVSRSSMTLPPAQVLKAASNLCTTPTFTREKAEACNADAENILPAVMPDGYYGYEVVQPREEDDLLGGIEAEWDPPLDDSVGKALNDLDNKKREIQKDKTKFKTTLDEISEIVLGVQNSKFGIDGELYALKDKCYSVKAGKYTYELCPFGGAKQKEGDAKSGTNLGQWDSAEYDNETGQRILKWDKGAKCWNGPMRSATAYVTCGAETKVLSADEPDTCRYVLQMESYIACDEAFKQLHEL